MKNIIQNSKILLISTISATMTACNSTGQNIGQQQITHESDNESDYQSANEYNEEYNNESDYQSANEYNESDYQYVSWGKEKGELKKKKKLPPELLSEMINFVPINNIGECKLVNSIVASYARAREWKIKEHFFPKGIKREDIDYYDACEQFIRDHNEVGKKLLLEHIASPINFRKNLNALHDAIRSRSTNVVSLLIEKGVDVHANALHDAATSGSISIVKLLLNSANINARNENGDTPLHVAATSGSISIVKLLLNSANINARNENGDTPLHVALRR